MGVPQVSNPTGLKRLFNNLLEALTCSQRALTAEEEEQKILLSHGEDELAQGANPWPGGRGGGAGQGRAARPRRRCSRVPGASRGVLQKDEHFSLPAGF